MAAKTVGGKILKAILFVILAIVIIAVALLAVLTFTEFKPADLEKVEVAGTPTKTLSAGDSIDIVTWNIGYAGLSEEADFFMDGGTHTRSVSEDGVMANMEGIISLLKSYDPDVIFIQEVDESSTRSYRIDETVLLADAFSDFTTAFAYNYKCLFVPFPMPPLARVYSGLQTLSRFGTSEFEKSGDSEIMTADRIQLPCPFSWPVRLANLKRGLLVERVQIEGSDAELVLINLHLEAYDSGEGKIAQTKLLAEFIKSEYEKGNYVIAGGDYNLTFSNLDTSMYPVQPGDLWMCGELDATAFEPDFQLVMDTDTPTCRSLDRPLDLDDPTFQFYMIDGFIVSKNVRIDKLETIDTGFDFSDHNPVHIQVTLQ